MPDHHRYPKRLNIYITAEMQRKLIQVRDGRGPQATVPEVVREALRVFLDDQEQVIGSRRHFQKTLREEIETAQDALSWNQIVIINMLSQWLSPLVSAVTRQQFTAQDLFVKALTQASQDWPAYHAALNKGQQQAYEVALKDSERK
jgi:hypothetical protein